MLPDRVIRQVREQVSLYFQDDDKKLLAAAVKLADAGFLMSDILDILSAAYRAGRNAA